MAKKDYKKKEEQVNYEERAREILEKAEPSFRFAMAVQFVGYHPEPVNRPTMPRSVRDITLVL